MIKIFKKAVSALLASIMCIPTGIIGTASAAETEGTAATTVTLTDTENGIMQFSEECMENSTADQNGYHMLQVNESGEMEQVENDGSVWAFNKGDAVEIELIPDDGYSVESFTIKAADTGDTGMDPERKRRGPVKRLSAGNRMVCGIISTGGLLHCCTYGTTSP